MKPFTWVETLIITFLFLFSIYMWSLPIKNNPLPYGEVDSAHHFGIANYMSETDRVSDEVYKPKFLYYGYSFRSTRGLGKIGLESPYASNFFVNEAIAQIIGGDQFVSYYLFLAISCVSIVLSSYFLIRKLFGIMPAFLSSLLISASKIDIMSFIMGQYVILVSFACLPLILYCYYKYTNSILENKPKKVYIFIMFFLIATQFFNHYQALIDTFMTLLIFSIFLFIKERKIFFKIKHLVLALIILFILTGPFLDKPVSSVIVTANVSSTNNRADVSNNFWDFLKWYTEGYSGIAIGQSIFSYKEMHGYWTLPLLVIGILLLLLKRKNKDLLLLSWIIALYLILHLDLMLGMSASRLLRSVNDVPLIFYPLIAMGFMGIMQLFNFIKIKKVNRYLIYVFVLIFVFLVINFNLKSSFVMLDQAYPYPYRINPNQLEAALWMNENLPQDALINNLGTLIPKTTRFINMVSQRYTFEGDIKEQLDLQKGWHPDEKIEVSYYLIDYSELIMFGMQKEADALLQWENINLGNLTPIYNKNNIRIYDIGKA